MANGCQFDLRDFSCLVPAASGAASEDTVAPYDSLSCPPRPACETAGADAVAYRDDMRARYEQEFQVTLAGLAYDAAQTGAATMASGQWRGFPLVRS